MLLEIEKKKRSFRSLWISRINAGSRELGVSYSKLINGMNSKNILIDRKILSEIVVSDRTAFKQIVDKAIN